MPLTQQFQEIVQKKHNDLVEKEKAKNKFIDPKVALKNPHSQYLLTAHQEEYEGEGGTLPLINVGGLYLNQVTIELLFCLMCRINGGDVGENIREAMDIMIDLEVALVNANEYGHIIAAIREGQDPFENES